MSKVIEAITEPDMETSDAQECVTKVCTKCKVEKILSDFSKHKSGKSGRRASCKKCNKQAAKIYKSNNLQEIRAKGTERKRRWRLNNKQKAREAERKREKINASLLSRRYVKKLLIVNSSSASINEDLVEIKTKQLQINRAIKQLKKAIQERKEECNSN